MASLVLKEIINLMERNDCRNDLLEFRLMQIELKKKATDARFKEFIRDTARVKQ